MTTKTKRRKLLQSLGDPKVVADDLRQFAETSRVLSAKQPRMITAYPKQWVALHEGKVTARASTLNALLRAVDKKQLSRDQVIVRFIEKNHRTLIL